MTLSVEQSTTSRHVLALEEWVAKNDNRELGDEAYVTVGDSSYIFITPKGCASGADHIGQDLAHEFGHMDLGHTSGYYRNHPLPDDPNRALAPPAEVAGGFALQRAGTTIVVH